MSDQPSQEISVRDRIYRDGWLGEGSAIQRIEYRQIDVATRIAAIQQRARQLEAEHFGLALHLEELLIDLDLLTQPEEIANCEKQCDVSMNILTSTEKKIARLRSFEDMLAPTAL